MFRSLLAITFALAASIYTFAADPQQSGDQNKNLDVRSSVGDLHLGADADARKAGLPLYPGARIRHDEKDSSALNLGLLTDAFGIKLVIAKYESDDAPAKVIDYYRERLKKFGKVLECHTHELGTEINDGSNNGDEHSKELKCEGDNTGPVTELKVGTENNQHVVAIEPNKDHAGSIFALVYLYDRGKRGDI